MVSRASRTAESLPCVLLAAGGSSRLGAPKQLVRTTRMQPLIIRAIDVASSVGGLHPIIAVLGAEAARVRALLRRRRPHVRIVLNARWSEGLAGSLRRGLRAAPSGARAVLVLLVDQPAIDTLALARLIAAWRRRPRVPAAALYDGRAGVPAILPRTALPALAAMRGDRGARALLRAASEITLVAMPEARIDIDTPADLARLR